MMHGQRTTIVGKVHFHDWGVRKRHLATHIRDIDSFDRDVWFRNRLEHPPDVV
jgi:hypothetical protein